VGETVRPAAASLTAVQPDEAGDSSNQIEPTLSVVERVSQLQTPIATYQMLLTTFIMSARVTLDHFHLSQMAGVSLPDQPGNRSSPRASKVS